MFHLQWVCVHGCGATSQPGRAGELFLGMGFKGITYFLGGLPCIFFEGWGHQLASLVHRGPHNRAQVLSFLRRQIIPLSGELALSGGHFIGAVSLSHDHMGAVLWCPHY